MAHIAARPTRPVGIPARVRALAGTDAVESVWRNTLGGLTFRLTDAGGGERYVKWSTTGDDVVVESERLEWAAGWTEVPTVIDVGRDDSGAWLVTRGIRARSAVDPVWLADPTTAVLAIGQGLRKLHDVLPVDSCPYSWSREARISRADERIAAGMTPADWFAEHASLSVSEARRRLDDPPAVDRYVVCHGDPCAPNTLIGDDGGFAAHVDLGSLGIADRWADIAVAAWSTEWNYGPGYTDLLYAAYGVEPDLTRIAYYRLLWDLS